MSLNDTQQILLIVDNDRRFELLQRAVSGTCYEIGKRLSSIAEFATFDQDWQAIAVISVESLSEADITHISAINQRNPQPMIIFVESNGETAIQQVIKAGVSAFIPDELQPLRVKSIIDIAIARFKEIQHLRCELEDTRSRLEERKIVDKAKGLLMRERNMNEEEAYQSLRKMAMDKGQKLATVAENVVEIFTLIKA